MSDAPWNPNNPYDDLDSFSASYRPKHSFAAGIDTLPDGLYDCEVILAALDMIDAHRICRIDLRTTFNQQVQWTVWLNKQEGVNGFCADLCVLGFDADRWGPQHQRPLSVELPKAIAKLKGLKFRAHKSSRQGTGQWAGKVYHDLRIQCRLAGQAMPAITPPVNGVGAGSGAPAPAVQEVDVPF